MSREEIGAGKEDMDTVAGGESVVGNPEVAGGKTEFV